MKKILLLLIFILSCSVIFTACDDYSTPQEFYYIETNYDLGHTEIQLNNDRENEQFIAMLNSKTDQTIYFSFVFNGSIGGIINSAQFTYKDNLGNDITFNDLGYYEYVGERIFYISYKNANNAIKTDILNDNYSLEVASYDFMPNH